jgi:hypothetical protein
MIHSSPQGRGGVGGVFESDVISLAAQPTSHSLFQSLDGSVQQIAISEVAPATLDSFVAPVTALPPAQVLSIDAVAAPPQVAGAFGQRHPTLAKALAHTAAKAVVFVVVAPMYIFSLVQTPVRVAMLLQGAISPPRSIKQLNNKMYELFFGKPRVRGLNYFFETEVKDRTNNYKRICFGFWAVGDLLSGGTVFSFLKTFDFAQSLHAKVLKSTQKSLGLTAFVTEYDRIKKDMDKSPPLVTVIGHWLHFVSENGQALLDLSVWKKYSDDLTTASNQAKSFSALLQKLHEGFPGVSKTNYSYRNELQDWGSGREENVRQFSSTRLVPVLQHMERRPDLTYRVFDLSFDALGECHDRPPLAWVDIELESQVDQKIQEWTESRRFGRGNDALLSGLIQCEIQKMCKGLAQSHALQYLHPRYQPLWHWDPRLEGHAEIPDNMENVLHVYELIQKKHPSWFPELPYRNYAASYTDADMQRLADLIESQIQTSLTHPTREPLFEHLGQSDSWQQVLEVKFPIDTKVRDANLKAKQKEMNALLTREKDMAPEEYGYQAGLLMAQYNAVSETHVSSEDIKKRQDFTQNMVDNS